MTLLLLDAIEMVHKSASSAHVQIAKNLRQLSLVRSILL